MAASTLQLISPAWGSLQQSEAEVFGCVVWLFMQSSTHQGMPLCELGKLVLPAMQKGQFVLATQEHAGHTRPVGFMSWTNFSDEAEARYTKTLHDSLTLEDWNSGDRSWIVHYLTPLGHAAQFRKAVQNSLPQARFRALYHRGDERGLKVLYFRGSQVSRQQEHDWWSSRPMALTTAR